MKYKISNYIYYRTNNELKEGRIAEISSDKVLVIGFSDFKPVELKQENILGFSGFDPRKKIKLTFNFIFPENIYKILMGDYSSNSNDTSLKEDGAQDKKYFQPYSIYNLITEFNIFLRGSEKIAESGEFEEICTGFLLCFNYFLYKCLLYKKELKELEENNDESILYVDRIEKNKKGKYENKIKLLNMNGKDIDHDKNEDRISKQTKKPKTDRNTYRENGSDKQNRDEKKKEAITSSFGEYYSKFPKQEGYIDYAKLCKPIYLLRLLAFIQLDGKYLIEDRSINEILYEYSVYLLDFISLNKDFYFQEISN